jgi:hypothetical protein
VCPRLLYFYTQRALIRSNHGLFFTTGGGTSTVLFEHCAHMALALAAAKRDTQLELQLVERVDAFGDDPADVAVRY